MTDFTLSIIGGTIWGNRGAGAMLETLIGEVRTARPQARFNVYTYYPTQDRALVSEPTVKIYGARPRDLIFVYFPAAVWVWLWSVIGLRWPSRWLPEGVAALRESVGLVDIAGISFSDGREIFLPYNVLSIWPALLMKVPVGKCSQAMGPFRKFFNRTVAGFFLPRCRFIVARGARTAINLAELAISADRLSELPDLAFLHKDGYALSTENDDRTTPLIERLRNDRRRGRKIICVNPSSLVAKNCQRQGVDYAGALARFVRAMLDRNHAVLLVPTATREAAGASGRNNDLPVIRAILQSVAPDGNNGSLHAVYWDINFSGLKHCMAECDVALVSRFHGLVCALSLGLPAIALGWGHKYREMMDMFGMGSFTLDYRELEKNALVDKILGILDRIEDRKASLERNFGKVRQQATRQIELVLSLADGPAGSRSKERQ